MIHNLIVDYNKSTKINAIEHSNVESVNSFTRKIRFFNPNINEPLHKFWYHIPNAKLIKKGSGTITVVLSSNDTNLIESIKNLDDATSEIIKNHNEHYRIDRSISLSVNYPPMLTLIVDHDSKCFNHDNSSISYMNIKNGTKIQIYIEFESIMMGSTECYRKWRILQLKEIKSLDMTVNLFDLIPGNMQGQIVPETLAPGPGYNHYPGYGPTTSVLGAKSPYVPGLHGNIGSIPPPPPPVPPFAGFLVTSQITDTRVPVAPAILKTTTDRPSTENVVMSGFQPPSRCQLLNMISKLKKAANKNEQAKDNINNNEQIKQSNQKPVDNCSPVICNNVFSDARSELKTPIHSNEPNTPELASLVRDEGTGTGSCRNANDGTWAPGTIVSGTGSSRDASDGTSMDIRTSVNVDPDANEPITEIDPLDKIKLLIDEQTRLYKIYQDKKKADIRKADIIMKKIEHMIIKSQKSQIPKIKSNRDINWAQDRTQSQVHDPIHNHDQVQDQNQDNADPDDPFLYVPLAR
jgi:hypothetical protein